MTDEKSAVSENKGQIEGKKEKTQKPKGVNLEKYISAAGDFNELLAVLDMTSGIQGSKEFFDSKKLKEIIKKVRKGELDIEYVTRASGLRDRVAELSKWEKIRKAVEEKK